MPICTYIDDREIEEYYKKLDDPELKEVLDDVNKIDDGWSIQKQMFISRRTFRKSTSYSLYSLYYKTIAPEYQIINFAPVGEYTINTCVRKEDVLNFLTGYIGGYLYAKHKFVKQVDRPGK